MNNLPFNKPGRFFRGNLHTRSTLSDGLLTPEKVCHQYREAGYDFLSLTDHLLQQFNFPLAGINISNFNSPYARVTVRDAFNQRAWSNPVWFD